MDCYDAYVKACNENDMIIDYSWILSDDTMICSGDGIYLSSYIFNAVDKGEPIPEGPINGIVESFHFINAANGFVKIKRCNFGIVQYSYHHLKHLELCFVLHPDTILPDNHRQLLADHYKKCLSIRLQESCKFVKNSRDLFEILMRPDRTTQGISAICNAISYSKLTGQYFHLKPTSENAPEYHCVSINNILCQNQGSENILWSCKMIDEHLNNPIKKIKIAIPTSGTLFFDCKIYQNDGETLVASREKNECIIFFRASTKLIFD
jgi:hypothetical protein